MPMILLILSLLGSFSVFAEECTSEKLMSEDANPSYLGCRVTTETTTYALTQDLDPELVSDAACDAFCANEVLIPVPHHDHIHPMVIPRMTFDLICYAEMVARFYNPNLPVMTPEQAVQHVLSTQLFGTETDGQTENLFDQYVEAHTPQRDENKHLPEGSTQVVTGEWLKENYPQDICTVCRESLVAQSEAGEVIVKTCCNSDQNSQASSGSAGASRPSAHLFCHSCLDSHYQYQQNCPVCKGSLGEALSKLAEAGSHQTDSPDTMEQD